MALIVKTSLLPKAGRGLFTTKAFKKGARIIEYRGEIITWKEYQKRVERNEDGYLFFINNKRCIDAFHLPQYKARYANDAEGLSKIPGVSNNSEYEIDDNRCFIVATRDIKAGEEIYVDYTQEYWDAIRYNIKIGRHPAH